MSYDVMAHGFIKEYIYKNTIFLTDYKAINYPCQIRSIRVPSNIMKSKTPQKKTFVGLY